MKILRYALFALFTILAATSYATDYGIGVSKELATTRYNSYSNIIYTLRFDIPEDKDADITGKAIIEFDHPWGCDAVLDFRESPDKILSLKVTGKNSYGYKYKDEHIIIPGKYLEDGRNSIEIEFIAGKKPLNRNDEFVYTLLVPDRARTLFPCFDQPDLKATYRLTLDVPAGWLAVSNTSIVNEKKHGKRRTITFADTEPLSTYLFSFVAGKFNKETRSRDGRTISGYYRENDPEKIAELDTIFSQVFDALNWQENHTAIKYPFAKYDFVILPGFQFGGMEHTGATLYNDRMMFLGKHATAEEELSRAQLIAHETSHMWYGDLVTMRWFDDVWTKEVFANYFGAVISEPHFPNINHTLNRISSFYLPSMSQDRTAGRTAIQQPLDNLNNAGLIYNQIIYNKAPLVMFKIVDIMGEDAYKAGLRNYLTRYSYSNATWDDLVACLDAETDADIKSFSDVWIKSEGMPHLQFTPTQTGFDVTCIDPYDRGLVWEQSFTVDAIAGERKERVSVNIKESQQHYELGFKPDLLIPNSDGRGYGYFMPDEKSLQYLTDNWAEIEDDVTRMATVLNLYDNYLNHRITDRERLTASLISGLAKEQNTLISGTLISSLDFICTHLQGEERRKTELAMHRLANGMTDESAKLKMQRSVVRLMTEPSIVEDYYNQWSKGSNRLWNENDYTTASYELAIRKPELSDSILRVQRSRITNKDRIAQFDFISRACTPDSVRLDALFTSLREPSNRLVEPYAESLLYYLNHFTRDEYSARYIVPGLEMLQEVQKTGDIFFPGQWTKMLLGQHRSKEARDAVNSFLQTHPDYPILLKNKILQAADPLMWD
jgi:aminopeptidase N